MGQPPGKTISCPSLSPLSLSNPLDETISAPWSCHYLMFKAAGKHLGAVVLACTGGHTWHQRSGQGALLPPGSALAAPGVRWPRTGPQATLVSDPNTSFLGALGGSNMGMQCR